MTCYEQGPHNYEQGNTYLRNAFFSDVFWTFSGENHLPNYQTLGADSFFVSNVPFGTEFILFTF